MKQIFCKLLPLLIALSLLLSACGEYNPAVKVPGNNQEGTEADSDTSDVVTDAEGNVDENPFTVTLTVNGEVYVPSEEHPISVQWNDGYSIHTAPIGQDGVARVGGLDGDYRIRLTAIPAGYTYNPNVYTATNNNRNVEIELYKIVTTRGNGDQLYNAIEIKNTGLYCVELTSPTHEIFFEFAPPKSGTYSMESWMDTIDNKVNPQANYYGANRNGQYLGEVPTGTLQCLCVDTGSVPAEEFRKGPYLEVISMSGLQVDFNSDYIGGEVRLAYYHDGEKITPVTGISISGRAGEVLNNLHLSSEIAVADSYTGPKKALINCMKIY